MFKNVGRKIKLLAKINFAILTIAAFIVGIVLIAVDEDSIPIGLLVMVGGSLVSWIMSIFLYGFGEIIDKLRDIERNTRGGAIESEKQAEVDSERISKIEKLRSQGLITEEEYNQAISKEQ